MAQEPVTDSTLKYVGEHAAIERVNLAGLPKTVGAYRHGTLKHFGDPTKPGLTEINISGMLALDENGNLVGGDSYHDQTMQIFKNLATEIENIAHYLGNPTLPGEALEFLTWTNPILLELGEDGANFKEVNRAYDHAHVPYGARAAYAVLGVPLDKVKGTLMEVIAQAWLSRRGIPKP
ncbi:MAG: hypothetical protein V1735_01310 [Nanoarchaeota archaeon]